MSQLRSFGPLLREARAAGVTAARIDAIGLRVLHALARTRGPDEPLRREHADVRVLRALLRAALPAHATALGAVDTSTTVRADSDRIRARTLAVFDSARHTRSLLLAIETLGAVSQSFCRAHADGGAAILEDVVGDLR